MARSDNKITRKGPGLVRAQMIGDLARSALHANKPDCWILGEMPGDDFGYDFQAIAFDPEGEGAQCAFNIQLKGTTQSKARLASGNFLSYPFNQSTLQLWHRSGFAVIVVIVDLIDTQDQKEATVHYHFANYDLEKILPTLPPNQETVRLHVPIEQVVDKGLNILPIVLPYLDELADARRIIRDRNRAGGTTASDRMAFDAAKPGSNLPPSDVVLTGDFETFINASPDKTILQAALDSVRNGDYERALELCPHPTDNACRKNPKGTALAAYLRSMALDAVGDSESADYLTTLAESLLPDCDDIIGMAAQKKLNTIDFGIKGQKTRLEFLESLGKQSGLSVTIVKSKILALNGDFRHAREILESFTSNEIAIAKIIISTVELAWNRVLTEVNNAKDLSTLRPKQRLWLEVLESRAQFELALQKVPRPSSGEFVIPSGGLPQIDYDVLRLAYQASRRAMLSAQRLNWPADISYILDVFPISAMVLGYMQEAMPLMAALGLSRASVTQIREVVAKLAVQLDQPEIALQLGEQAGTSTKFEHEASVMAVAALKADQIDKALAFVTDDFLLDPSIKDMHLSSLLMLGMAANSILRGDLLEKIQARLYQYDESRHYGVMLDSAIHIQKNLLQRFEVIKKLHTYWSESGHPTVVGYHLLTNLNPQSEDEAELFVEVAEYLEVENSLGDDELADYGEALLTVHRVDDSIAKLRFALNRFRNNPKIKSLLGIALEVNGQSHEAFKLFEQLLDEGNASDTARRYFVEIAARMGFFELAEQQVRAAFSRATVREQKLRLLNTLFQLLNIDGARPDKIEEVAWEYGRYANQSDEREEGIFLQEYLVATIPEGLEVIPDRTEEFSRRLNSYNERFPKSKFLWRIEVPANGPPEEMIKALQEATRLTDKDIEDGNITEQKMDRGALEVPFSWRPRKFLRNIPDLFMLWEIRKRAPLERAALHIRSTIVGYERKIPKNIGSCEAVISLTSLVLLNELGLLTTVLNSFPRLVVARATLITLQEARNSFTGSWGKEQAIRIIEQLQDNFSKISHPSYGVTDIEQGAPDWYYEEIRAMEQTGRVYFSDDIVETYLVCSTDDNGSPRYSISTVDFLAWADQSAGIFSPHKVADAIGHMIRLKIMSVKVTQRYFLAAIPDALNRATNQAQADKALRSAETFKSILNGVWFHDSPFENLLTHFSANMCYLLNDVRAGEEVLVSLWLHWLGAVRFQEKPRILPIKKMGMAFIRILGYLKSDKDVVRQLWVSFWVALQRGFENELDRPEDKVAIELIANILGAQRAIIESEANAIRLFEIAKIGLESGTEQEELLTNQYIDAMVRQERSKQTSS